MKQLWKQIRREDGASQMIEAAIIYPVVFLCIFVLIYIGLYILQTITVSTYAQKVAMLTAREISCPGYLSMISGDLDVYANSAVEGSDDLFNKLVLNNDPGKGESQTYRYWKSDIEDMMPEDTYNAYRNILIDMVSENSIITSKDRSQIGVEITLQNNVIVQYVNVSVSQPLMGFPVLDFFGIETPTVSASAQTTVNDTDELVRNVDFVTDALAAFSKKIGLDIGALKEKIKSVKDTLGLDK